MTAPAHSLDVRGRGRYYGPCDQPTCPLGNDGGDLFMSVTNAQSIVAKPALVPAAVKLTAEAAWTELPRMVATSRQSPNGPCAQLRVAERCGVCRFCVTSAIKNHHRNEWESKADFGTLVHRYGHAHVLGGALPYDEDVAPFIGQYVEFLDRMGVDLDEHVEAAETTVFDRDHRYAGTGDVWIHLPVDPVSLAVDVKGQRWLWLVDLKTSLTKPANTVYADQVLQLAGLRYAPRTVLVNDQEIETPVFAGAALLNLRADDHALIPLPADKTAHAAFLDAVRLQRFFHDHVDTKAWSPLDVPTVTEPSPAQ